MPPQAGRLLSHRARLLPLPSGARASWSWPSVRAAASPLNWQRSWQRTRLSRRALAPAASRSGPRLQSSGGYRLRPLARRPRLPAKTRVPWEGADGAAARIYLRRSWCGSRRAPWSTRCTSAARPTRCSSSKSTQRSRSRQGSEPGRVRWRRCRLSYVPGALPGLTLVRIGSVPNTAGWHACAGEGRRGRFPRGRPLTSQRRRGQVRSVGPTAICRAGCRLTGASGEPETAPLALRPLTRLPFLPAPCPQPPTCPPSCGCASTAGASGCATCAYCSRSTCGSTSSSSRGTWSRSWRQ